MGSRVDGGRQVPRGGSTHGPGDALGRTPHHDHEQLERHSCSRAHHRRRNRDGSRVRVHRARVWGPAPVRCGLRWGARPRGPELHDRGRLGGGDLLMDEPRRAPIHPSLTRPLLLGGAERELVLMNGTIIAALIFGVGFHWVSLTMAGLLATIGHWAVTPAAKYDPP